MPLTMANIGETNTIKRVGGNEETRRFLANLGFVVDADYSLINEIKNHQQMQKLQFYLQSAVM